MDCVRRVAWRCHGRLVGLCGHRPDKPVGAAGAAVGGSAGAVSGALQDKPSSIYRQYVQRCLSDKGFEVIGWNQP